MDGGPCDEDKVGCFVALTPTWNESAWFADYVLPMGHGSERHDTHSYEQYDGQWVGFRQPVLRAARDRLGEQVTDTRQVNPGEVWEENEFWIELSWRIDPDGTLGIRRYHESRARPGEKLTVDEYYGWMFENSVPGLPERAAAEGLTPLECMRRYGAFEIAAAGRPDEQEVPAASCGRRGRRRGPGLHHGRRTPDPNIVPAGAPEPDDAGPPAGRVRSTASRRGFPTPSGRLEFWSSTLADWGWPEHALPGYIRSHVHPDRWAGPDGAAVHLPAADPDPHPLGELEVARRAGAHQPGVDPPRRRRPARHRPTGDLVRVETEIGYFVAKAWITEGIRPGVVACSHHMGRWRLDQASAAAAA